MTFLSPSITVSSTRLLETSTLISQGAEAAIYKAHLRDRAPDGYEPNSTQHSADLYWHPSLDASLTRVRISGEVRALMRCLRSGVKVPGIRMIDAAGGVLGIEWVDGMNVRVLLAGDAEPEDAGVGEDEPEPDCADAEGEDEVDPLGVYGISRGKWAKMHLADIIHGNLTSSNMMLRRGPNDLRAFASTHPDSEPLFASVLAAYGARMGSAQWASVKKRLDDVRLRGRKWNMVG
ncbi:hypothetical protein BV22DRAFT_1107765 [Leucogyrophana mollusca]|uniref:Uncharacterized protein n=1 Tax=Leucogyrophana mollusca TaxID=85980 RepID=A0ACB8B3U6_9AGAM|nr:hypothetical protein BV22DRAFT_1107765 [Leucogyrophana mollusca]